MLTFADIQIGDNMENESNSSLLGYILTDKDGWTEGLIKDSNGNKKFIFGVSHRPNSLQLYLLNPNNSKDFYEFSATKSSYLYTFYTGKTFLIRDSSKQYISPCKISSRLLEKDPRDFDNSEKEEFINNLESWKVSNLTDGTDKIYQKYLTNRTALTKSIDLDNEPIH